MIKNYLIAVFMFHSLLTYADKKNEWSFEIDITDDYVIQTLSAFVQANPQAVFNFKPLSKEKFKSINAASILSLKVPSKTATSEKFIAFFSSPFNEAESRYSGIEMCFVEGTDIIVCRGVLCVRDKKSGETNMKYLNSVKLDRKCSTILNQEGQFIKVENNPNLNNFPGKSFIIKGVDQLIVIYNDNSVFSIYAADKVFEGSLSDIKFWRLGSLDILALSILYRDSCDKLNKLKATYANKEKISPSVDGEIKNLHQKSLNIQDILDKVK